MKSKRIVAHRGRRKSGQLPNPGQSQERAVDRPKSGHGAVTPRTRSKQFKPQTEHRERSRVRRVNQKMVNRMIELRQQGVSHGDIGTQVGCSERTVRRHTKGVSPHLVHATDPKTVDFITWCSQRMFAAKDRLELSVPEIDAVIKVARDAISKLDPLTAQQLILDPKVRLDFHCHVVWPLAAQEIRSMRWMARIEAEFGPLQKNDDG